MTWSSRRCPHPWQGVELDDLRGPFPPSILCDFSCPRHTPCTHGDPLQMHSRQQKQNENPSKCNCQTFTGNKPKDKTLKTLQSTPKSPTALNELLPNRSCSPGLTQERPEGQTAEQHNRFVPGGGKPGCELPIMQEGLRSRIGHLPKPASLSLEETQGKQASSDSSVSFPTCFLLEAAAQRTPTA